MLGFILHPLRDYLSALYLLDVELKFFVKEFINGELDGILVEWANEVPKSEELPELDLSEDGSLIYFI